jgi:alkyl sulfatase BDS1-like metallo-beta-lactamase superfamily hydrolase
LSTFTHIANNCFAVSLIQVNSNGVFNAKSDKSCNNSFALSALHNIVLNAISACSKLAQSQIIALAHTAIHQAIAAQTTCQNLIKELEIQSNFDCKRLKSLSQVFT